MKKLYYPIHLILSSKRKKSIKKPPYKGERFTVPRNGKAGVDTCIYIPEKNQKDRMPVIFNVHGGAWLAGDVFSMDDQSRRLAERLGCVFVHIGYKLCDEEPFPYQQHEVVDTVKYFAKNSEKYNIDTEKMSLLGYSAGGHICAGAAILLRDDGIKIRSQILCYPFLNFVGFRLSDFAPKNKLAPKIQKIMENIFFEKVPMTDTVVSPGNAPCDKLTGLPECVIIGCGPDVLLPHSKEYETKLKAAGVPVCLEIYEKAEHGFLETQSPDSGTEQSRYMNECETFICNKLREQWGIENE